MILMNRVYDASGFLRLPRIRLQYPKTPLVPLRYSGELTQIAAFLKTVNGGCYLIESLQFFVFFSGFRVDRFRFYGFYHNIF